MTRAKVLAVLRAAGASGDRELFTRTYISSRVSLKAANAEWSAGQKFRAFILERDKAKQP